MSRIADQLRIHLAQLQALELTEAKLAEVMEHLKRNQQYLVILKERVDKEWKDVEDMEKWSIKGIFHTVVGNKEAQKTKEEEEYRLAALKYNEFVDAVQELDASRQQLEAELAKGSQIRVTIHQLIEQRGQELSTENSEWGERYRKLEYDHKEALTLRKGWHSVRETGIHIEKLAERLEYVSGWLRRNKPSVFNWFEKELAELDQLAQGINDLTTRLSRYKLEYPGLNLGACTDRIPVLNRRVKNLLDVLFWQMNLLPTIKEYDRYAEGFRVKLRHCRANWDKQQEENERLISSVDQRRKELILGSVS